MIVWFEIFLKIKIREMCFHEFVILGWATKINCVYITILFGVTYITILFGVT